MAFDGSGTLSPAKKGGGAAVAGDDLEDSRRFECCVCLDLLYKPIVLACGHISCFWCVYKAMHTHRESHCAVCRQPYHHFPNICQLLHHLLLKLEPVDYRRREKEILEEEKLVDTYSPQFIEFVIPNNNNCEIGKSENKPEAIESRAPEEVSSNDNIIGEHLKKVAVEDVLCPLCKKLLYQPAVLNCGHVYCISCLSCLDGEALKCQVCESLHPGEFPNVCLDLDHFLEEYFPVEYASRREKVQLKKSNFHPGESSSDTSLAEESKSTQQKNKAELSQDFTKEGLSNVHSGVGCDSCGMHPIRGKRYKCKDCTELIGFDLCEACYNTRSKLPGRFNQQHTPEHRMELDDSRISRMWRSVPIPEEVPEELVLEAAFLPPGGLMPILPLPDDLEEEENGEQRG